MVVLTGIVTTVVPSVHLLTALIVGTCGIYSAGTLAVGSLDQRNTNYWWSYTDFEWQKAYAIHRYSKSGSLSLVFRCLTLQNFTGSTVG